MMPYAMLAAAITCGEMHEEEWVDAPYPRQRHPYMQLCASFVALTRSLYVDSYTFTDTEVISHEVMTRVKTMRIWNNIERVYESGRLSSRIVTNLPIEWESFTALQRSLYDMLRIYAESQTATRVELNAAILELLRLLHDMILLGFVPSGALSTAELASTASKSHERLTAPPRPTRVREVTTKAAVGYNRLNESGDETDGAPEINAAPPGPPELPLDENPSVRRFIPLILRILDGTADRMDEVCMHSSRLLISAHICYIAHVSTQTQDHESSAGDPQRYEQIASITHNTVVIMESKLWACRILQARARLEPLRRSRFA